MGLWVVSVSGSCMSLLSLPLATGSRKNVPLSLVRFVKLMLTFHLPRVHFFYSLFCTGISTCGSGFGTIVFAPVVTHLLEWSNWQWTNRIIAGFCLLVFFFLKIFVILTISPLPVFSNIFMNKFFRQSDIISSVHLPGTDHETGAKAQVRKHRQHYRDETEERADYQGEQKDPGFKLLLSEFFRMTKLSTRARRIWSSLTITRRQTRWRI